MSKIVRLGFLVLLIWLLAGITAWLSISPPPALVGIKRSAPPLVEGSALDRPDLGRSLSVLESHPIWGVARDGKPLPPPKPKEEITPVFWTIVSTVVRKNERYALVMIEKEAPKAIKEGEELPNGSKLISVQTKQVVHQDAAGQQHTIILSY